MTGLAVRGFLKVWTRVSWVEHARSDPETEMTSAGMTTETGSEVKHILFNIRVFLEASVECSRCTDNLLGNSPGTRST